MRKNPSVKFQLLIGLIAFLFICFLNSCRKTDQPSSKVDEPDAIAKSLQVPVNSSSFINRISQVLNKQNKKSRFLNRFEAQEGLPVWDKISVYLSNSGMRNRGAASTDTIVLVPLVLENTRVVSSFLICEVQIDTILIKLIRGRQYKLFSFSKKTDTITANAVASQLMYMQSQIFGDTTFIIKDSRLFNYEKAGVIIKPKHVTIRRAQQENAQNKMMSITYTQCYTNVYDGDQGQLVGVSPDGTNDYPSSETVCYPVTVWFDDGTGYGGGGGTTDSGTSTGGGGGGYTDPYGDPCPVAETNIVARMAPEDDPCGGDLGWEPEPVPVMDDNGYYFNRIAEFKYNIQQNPHFLINPCDYLNQYLSLANYQVPQVVSDRIAQVNQGYLNTNNPAMWQYVQNPCYLQDINDASSAVVNFDYFPIHITTLPTVNGIQLTAPQLFEYFRSHWNDFVDNNIATFQPYQDPVVNDVNLWNSTNPITTMLHLDMAFNGTVIVSQYDAEPNSVKMTVTTVRTPLDGTHPVSGNRTWGIAPDTGPAGGYFFYTTGVDRVTGLFETVANTWLDRLPLFQSGFESADLLWTSLQNKMIQFIQNHGGQAELYNYLSPNYILRPEWSDVDLYLKNKITLNELLQKIGC